MTCTDFLGRLAPQARGAALGDLGKGARSRAVVPALLRPPRPPAYVVEMDEQGRPILEADRRYGEALICAPRRLSLEEWTERYAPPEPDNKG